MPVHNSPADFVFLSLSFAPQRAISTAQVHYVFVAFKAALRSELLQFCFDFENLQLVVWLCFDLVLSCC